jgi:hypothetical protein
MSSPVTAIVVKGDDCRKVVYDKKKETWMKCDREKKQKCK